MCIMLNTFLQLKNISHIDIYLKKKNKYDENNHTYNSVIYTIHDPVDPANVGYPQDKKKNSGFGIRNLLDLFGVHSFELTTSPIRLIDP